MQKDMSETILSHGGGEGCAPVTIFSPTVGRLARLWLLYPCPHTTGVECHPQRTGTLHVLFYPPLPIVAPNRSRFKLAAMLPDACGRW